jgi:hypothetical protein
MGRRTFDLHRDQALRRLKVQDAPARGRRRVDIARLEQAGGLGVCGGLSGRQLGGLLPQPSNLRVNLPESVLPHLDRRAKSDGDCLLMLGRGDLLGDLDRAPLGLLGFSERTRQRCTVGIFGPDGMPSCLR